MWQPISTFIMDWLDPIGVVWGLVVTLPVIWTWYEVVFGERRRRRRWFEQIRRTPGERPALLIVDLLEDKDIRPSVERFRAGREGLRDIPADRIFTLRRDRALTPEDMKDLHGELRKMVANILAAGADRVHYFHAGPAVVAALVGAEFANAAQLILYQHRPGNSDYENFGPLRLRS
ncbi:MAG: SAVED domain-containing protein [Methylohalobius sp. ZOD2]